LRRADEEEPDEKDDEKSKSPEPQSSEIAKALFKSRTILVFGEVDMKMAERVTAQLLAYAESEGDIRVILNSPGGHVESGDTIHDMIRFVGNRVKMIGTGWVASAGAHIFLGAKRENRYCLPFTRFLLHQPLGGVRGQASHELESLRRASKLSARSCAVRQILAISRDPRWLSNSEDHQTRQQEPSLQDAAPSDCIGDHRLIPKSAQLQIEAVPLLLQPAIY
jgi:ATP-dependent Clp endopeptidase proteolytic subunit ClpP